MRGEKKAKYGSLIAGVVAITLALVAYSQGQNSIGAALFLGGIISSILTYGLHSYFWMRRLDSMEEELPGMLKSLSESLKSGMSFPQAFQNVAESDHGALNPLIQKAADQLSWGIPFHEVMRRFSDSVEGSELLARTVDIILQAYKSGGDVPGTMDAIAQSSTEVREAIKERSSKMHQQVVVIYAIYFLFVGIIIALFGVLKPIFDIGFEMGGDFLGGGGATNPCLFVAGKPFCQLAPILGLGEANAKMSYYKSLFFVMLIIQGAMSGLVSGEIYQGKASAGFKHSLILISVGIFSYLFLLAAQ